MNPSNLKALFAGYPEAEELHFTSDEMPFFQKHHAEAHARDLENKSVTTVKRAEVGAAAAEGAGSGEPGSEGTGTGGGSGAGEGDGEGEGNNGDPVLTPAQKRAATLAAKKDAEANQNK